MIRRPTSQPVAVLPGVLSVALMLLGYTWLSHRQHAQNPDDTTIPSWSQLAKGVQTAVEVNKRSEERWLVVDAKASARRYFLGLGCGVIGSLAIGLLMGCFTKIEAFCYPPLSLLAKIPPTAALTAYLAVKEFPEELQFKAYTLGAAHLEVIWTIIFRQVFPKLIDALRLVLGPAMVYLIAAEMVVGDTGFGYRIRLQSKLLNMSVVYPYLALGVGESDLGFWGFGVSWAKRENVLTRPRPASAIQLR